MEQVLESVIDNEGSLSGLVMELGNLNEMEA
jgi:hypothetical protein